MKLSHCVAHYLSLFFVFRTHHFQALAIHFGLCVKVIAEYGPTFDMCLVKGAEKRLTLDLVETFLHVLQCVLLATYQTTCDTINFCFVRLVRLVSVSL